MQNDVVMMVLPGCPHCKHAFDLIDEVRAKHPEYAMIKIRVVDETQEVAFAEALDYYYVPTFFVGGKKIHEGHPTQEAILQVFAAALA